MRICSSGFLLACLALTTVGGQASAAAANSAEGTSIAAPAGSRSAYPQFSFSGFGTLGFAASDAPFTYLRFIDKDGAFKQDSILGGQLDIRLLPTLGLTVQGKAAPAADDDSSWEATLSRAFLSWRPTNELLLRVGRINITSLLHADNRDIQATFEFARLPPEVYVVENPNQNYDSITLSYSAELAENELTLIGIWGRADSHLRTYFRDTIPGLVEEGPFFLEITTENSGAILQLVRGEDIYRAGYMYAVVEPETPYPTEFPYVEIMPGIGYYQTSDGMPGPGVATAKKAHVNFYSLSADVGIPFDLRMTAEYAYRDVKLPNAGTIQGGYVALRKRFGRWTPYVLYAICKSDGESLDTYQRLQGNRVPDFIPGADLINASQRAGADFLMVYDQSSYTFGASYSLPPFAGIQISKIKAEWSRVEIGAVSDFVDPYQGGHPHDQSFNIFSLSYSYVF